VEDAALVYQILQGSDPMDETTWGRPPQDVLQGLKRGVRGLRLVFAETVFWEGVHPEVEQAVRACGSVLEGLGARVESIPFPEAEEARRLNPRGLIIAAEAYTINRKWLEGHFDDLDPLVAYRMIKGKEVPAFEYLENARAWERLRRSVVETLRDVDAILVPTTPIPAMPVGPLEKDRDLYAERNITYLRNTSIGNILNLCGLSVPCGFTSEGLPVGLMIYGKPFDEETILRVGWAFQQATSWHQSRPDLAWADRPDLAWTAESP
jgi:aspartyl-tRNA(Asn)/glutamyl-tRNA(Gln) amidotransferase subunit A